MQGMPRSASSPTRASIEISLSAHSAMPCAPHATSSSIRSMVSIGTSLPHTLTRTCTPRSASAARAASIPARDLLAERAAPVRQHDAEFDRRERLRCRSRLPVRLARGEIAGLPDGVQHALTHIRPHIGAVVEHAVDRAARSETPARSATVWIVGRLFMVPPASCDVLLSLVCCNDYTTFLCALRHRKHTFFRRMCFCTYLPA